MSTIVKCHEKEFREIIQDSIALSLRIDGSIDRMQIDKIYVMAKIIQNNGISKLLLLGIGEQTERRAAGLMQAVNKALCGFGDPSFIYSKTSSICTDGAGINTGEVSSLWVLLEDEIRKSGSTTPLIRGGGAIPPPFGKTQF